MYVKYKINSGVTIIKLSYFLLFFYGQVFNLRYIIVIFIMLFVITGLSTFSFTPRNSNSPTWKTTTQLHTQWQLLRNNNSCHRPGGDNPLSLKHTQYHHNHTTRAVGKMPNLGKISLLIFSMWVALVGETNIVFTNIFSG